MRTICLARDSNAFIAGPSEMSTISCDRVLLSSHHLLYVGASFTSQAATHMVPMDVSPTSLRECMASFRRMCCVRKIHRPR